MNKEQILKQASIEAVKVSETLNPLLCAQEEAIFIGGFQSGVMWILSGEPDPSPYQPGQKSPTAYLEEAWKNDSKDEMSIAVRALTAQARDHAEELEAFAVFAQDTVKELFRLMIEAAPDRKISDIVLTINPAEELIEAFRASRSGKKTEG